MSQTPKTLHIVLNGVTEDSRVLKCAWSLSNAGWDVLVVGSSPSGEADELTIGYARIIRLPLKLVIRKENIPKLFRALFKGETMLWLIAGVLRRLRK